MTIQVEDIVTTISNQLGIEPSTAEKTVGTILSLIKHEADGTRVAQLFAAIPGADDLANQHDVMTAEPEGQQSGGGLTGLLSSALGRVFGERTGAFVQSMSQLEATGLDTSQIQQAGALLASRAEQATSPSLVNEIIESVPGLNGILGPR